MKKRKHGKWVSRREKRREARVRAWHVRHAESVFNHAARMSRRMNHRKRVTLEDLVALEMDWMISDMASDTARIAVVRP